MSGGVAHGLCRGDPDSFRHIRGAAIQDLGEVRDVDAPVSGKSLHLSPQLGPGIGPGIGLQLAGGTHQFLQGACGLSASSTCHRGVGKASPADRCKGVEHLVVDTSLVIGRGPRHLGSRKAVLFLRRECAMRPIQAPPTAAHPVAEHAGTYGESNRVERLQQCIDRTDVCRTHHQDHTRAGRDHRGDDTPGHRPQQERGHHTGTDGGDRAERPGVGRRHHERIDSCRHPEQSDVGDDGDRAQPTPGRRSPDGRREPQPASNGEYEDAEEQAIPGADHAWPDIRDGPGELPQNGEDRQASFDVGRGTPPRHRRHPPAQGAPPRSTPGFISPPGSTAPFAARRIDTPSGPISWGSHAA